MMNYENTIKHIEDKLKEFHTLRRLVIKLTIYEMNMQCIEMELQEKGYWVEYRRIGGSDNFIIKVEW